MNLRQIEVFRAVMMAGSVTQAAQLLHVSQPGISRMLGHIELQLGVRLFVRGRGKLRPTPEALSLYAEVEQVYGGVQRIAERARSLKNGGGLSLRVLASPSTALEVVPMALSALSERFPAARFYMETQLVREMVGQLMGHDADIAISTLPIEQAPLVSSCIGQWSLACVFHAGHAFEKRRSVGLAEVMAERVIAFSPDTPQGRLMAEGWRAQGPAPMPRIEVRSGQVACALAACGAGIAVVDDLTARAWRSEKLRFRPLARGPSHDIFAVHNGNVAPSTLAAAFVEQVRAALRALRTVRRSGTAAL